MRLAPSQDGQHSRAGGGLPSPTHLGLLAARSTPRVKSGSSAARGGRTDSRHSGGCRVLSEHTASPPPMEPSGALPAVWAPRGGVLVFPTRPEATGMLASWGGLEPMNTNWGLKRTETHSPVAWRPGAPHPGITEPRACPGRALLPLPAPGAASTLGGPRDACVGITQPLAPSSRGSLCACVFTRLHRRTTAAPA